jgi:hypothetical protein
VARVHAREDGRRDRSLTATRTVASALPRHAQAVYVLLTGLLSHLALVVLTFLDPGLPFSRPVAKGSRSTNKLILGLFVFSLVGAILPRILREVYGHATATAIVFGVIIACSLILERMTRVRVERQAERLEFLG